MTGWQILKRLSRAAFALITVTAVLGGLFLWANAAPGEVAPPPPDGAATPAPVDPAAARGQASLVEREDRRIQKIKSGIAGKLSPRTLAWHLPPLPYRVRAASTLPTKVLTPRAAPYTLRDLGDSLVRQGGGTYLLRENLYLAEGAELSLGKRLTLRLASGPDGFASIVTYGGTLKIAGSEKARVTITSWDEKAKGPDKVTKDGRAYIRAAAGSMSLARVEATDLGFWSGRTGGVAYTGPGRNTFHGGKNTRHRKALSQVTGSVSASRLGRNAFGLYVSTMSGLRIRDTAVERSESDGVVLDGVKAPKEGAGAVLDRVTATGNGGDGIVVRRGSEHVLIEESTAASNTGNGFTIDGRPLAQGPSTSGDVLGSYGGNQVRAGTAEDNGRYGIEALGGDAPVIEGNRVEGGQMGIVTRHAVRGATVKGNRVTGQAMHGVAVLDGTAASVARNTVTAAPTAVYVRDSAAAVARNRVERSTFNGITLVGRVTGTQVSKNVIGGNGSHPINMNTATGRVKISGNYAKDWVIEETPREMIRRLLTPMALIWIGIAVLISLSAIFGLYVRVRRRTPDEMIPGKAPLEHGEAVEMTRYFQVYR